MLCGAHTYKTMYVASLYVQTALDAATPSTLAEILKETAVHGWIVVALLAEMKVPNLSRHRSNTKDSSGREAWHRTNSVGEEESGKIAVQCCGSEEKGTWLWANNFWIMNECKTGLRRMIGELAQEVVTGR